MPVKPAAERLPVAYLSSYLATPLPRPVYPVDVSAGITDWGMLGNGPDPAATAHPAGVNNALFAGLQHYRMAKSAASGEAVRLETSDDLVAEYLAYSRGADSGASVADLLLYLYKIGRIIAFAPVDHANPAEVDAAMAAFHGVYVGVNLTEDADALFEQDRPWTMSDGQRPNPRDGHCVVKVGADGREFDTWVTWGAVQKSTREWSSACVEEAWVVITREDAGPVNLNIAALRADIDALHGSEPAAACSPVVPSKPRPADVTPGTGADRPSPPAAAVVDDDVRFTVYRPHVLSPGRWAPLVVFAHKTDLVVEPGRGLIDPIEQVEARARAHFGGAPPRPVAGDARRGLARGAQLRIVPDLPGLRCNPPEAEIDWWEPVHEVVFRLLAGPELAATTVRGAVRIWCGPLIVGEVSIAIRVATEGPSEEAPPKAEPVQRYRRIFPSYSHRDRAVVASFAEAAKALGDQYLQDVLALRAGERWDARLLELIEDADVFQLFWSSHSMRSPHCRDEWEHALALQRPLFIRPIYWEDPLPEDQGKELPPAALRALHFVKVPIFEPRALPKAPTSTPGAPGAPAYPRPGPAAGGAAPAHRSRARSRRLRLAVASAATAAGLAVASLVSIAGLSGGAGLPLPAPTARVTSAPPYKVAILNGVDTAKGVGFSIGLYSQGSVGEPTIFLTKGGWVKLTLIHPAFTMRGVISCLVYPGACKISVYTGARYLGSANTVSLSDINIKLHGARMIEIVAGNRLAVTPNFR